MKPDRRFPHVATVFFLLTAAVALCSWIGSIYGWGTVQSLLSPEGIRWELRHVTGNFVNTPALGISVMLFWGFGLAARSGMGNVMRRAVRKGNPVSRKEKRALIFAMGLLAVYVLVVACLTLSPWSILHSVTGSFADSPFQRGVFYLVSLGAGISGAAYGYASGRFRDDKDIVRGMSYLVVCLADYFVILFFIVQFFSALIYTNLAEWLGIRLQVVRCVFHICCFLPLLWMLCRPGGFSKLE